MKIYNFTNRWQDWYEQFFKNYYFDKIVDIKCPNLLGQTEEEADAAVRAALPSDLKSKHFLVEIKYVYFPQKTRRVCKHALKIIRAGGGYAYYIYAKRGISRGSDGMYKFSPDSLCKA